MYTFKTFLRALEEDAEADIAKLNIAKQQLIVRKNAATVPLDTQINNADKQLMAKEKQKAVDDKRKGVTPQTAGQQQPQGSQARTPGSTGASTPGQGSPQVSNTPRAS